MQRTLKPLFHMESQDPAGLSESAQKAPLPTFHFSRGPRSSHRLEVPTRGQDPVQTSGCLAPSLANLSASSLPTNPE